MKRNQQRTKSNLFFTVIESIGDYNRHRIEQQNYLLAMSMDMQRRENIMERKRNDLM